MLKPFDFGGYLPCWLSAWWQISLSLDGVSGLGLRQAAVTGACWCSAWPAWWPIGCAPRACPIRCFAPSLFRHVPR
jgi:hypothetical protein